MKSSLAVLLSVTTLSLFCGSLAAQQSQTSSQYNTASTVSVPRLITFNGILRDGRGLPLTGSVGVIFGLYKDPEGGAPMWTENQNLQLDDQGRYTVFLGATAALPLDLFASGDPRWLGVQAQTPGGLEQPRVFLVSVPYALKAADADTIGGKPVSAFVLAHTAEQPDPATDNTSSDVRSSPKFTASGTGTPPPSGTLGNSSIQDNGSGVSVAIDPSDNVGIGTTTPSQKLQVNGIIGALSSGALALWDASNADYAYLKNMGADADSMRLGFVTGVEALSVARNGNIGIGTPTPAVHLEVAGSNQQVNVTDTSTGYSNIRFSNGNSSLYIGQERSLGSALLSGSSPNAGVINMANANPLQLGTSNTVRMTIDNSGNVGIGTTFPGSRLDVAGDIRASGALSSFQMTSTASTGTPPLVVNSTTQVANLNASLLGGQAASSFGKITNVVAGAGMNGGGTTGPVTVSQSPAALTRGITYLGGCDTCSTLADTDSQRAIYFNVVGSMTINSVTCFSDMGSPLINIQRESGGSPANVLNTNLTCSPTGATSTDVSDTQGTLSLNDMLDFAMVSAGGVAKRVTVSIKATVN